MSDNLSERLARVEERSVTALEQQARHEAECNARYERIEKSLVALFTRWWTVAAGVIGALLMACGYLLINGTPWK